MNLDRSIQFSTTFLIHQLKSMMGLVRIVEKIVQQQTDRNRRIQFCVIVTFLQLIGIQLAHIVHHSLHQARMK